MTSEYSWRDGWALTFPHPLPPKQRVIYKEPVSRCSCGSWIHEQNTCAICAIMEGKK